MKASYGSLYSYVSAKKQTTKKQLSKTNFFCFKFLFKVNVVSRTDGEKKRGYHVSTLMPFWLKPTIKVVINNDALNDRMYSLKITCSPSTPGIPGDPGSPC